MNLRIVMMRVIMMNLRMIIDHAGFLQARHPHHRPDRGNWENWIIWEIMVAKENNWAER